MGNKAPIWSIIIFFIIVLIGIVIIKKFTYISKMAAYSELNLLQEKLMTIETNLNSGKIKKHESFIIKYEACKENDFFCSLVESCKFLSFYENIRILIIAVNFLLLFFIAVISLIFEEVAIKETINIYFPLIMGNGILCMLPSLMLSITMGIIIARLRYANKKEINNGSEQN